MLQVARLAPKLLSESADLVTDFLHGEHHPGGGFKNRAGEPDLYYTVFGLEGLAALRADPQSTTTRDYLQSFGRGEGLDLVHLACLARCWANLPAGERDQSAAAGCLDRLEAFRASDGGYGPNPGAANGTVYGAFLVAGAYGDLGSELPDSEGLLRSVDSLKAADGGFANQAGAAVGSTPATAAAVTLFRYLDGPPVSASVEWLLARCRADGGFLASPAAPVPDVLSTATALHALVGAHASIDHIKEPCLDFLDSLWSSRGGFYGHWADDHLDCEYTYYALLALGHLSL